MSIVTYEHPIAGLVAPTAAQMAVGYDEVVAQVDVELYDTTITVTHNMQISAADLAAGFPEVDICPLENQVNSAAPFITAANHTANTVVFTVTDPVTQFNALFRVTIRRPWSKDK